MSVKRRFAAFKRVVVDAAQPPPLYPAYYAYRAATNGDERRTAYDAMTTTDQRFFWATVHESIDANLKAVSDERRAIQAESKARDIV